MRKRRLGSKLGCRISVSSPSRCCVCVLFFPKSLSGLVADPNAPLKVQEPMLLAITVYMSVIYGILYLNFVAYPIIFQQGHGFKAGPSGLMVRQSAASRFGSLSYEVLTFFLLLPVPPTVRWKYLRRCSIGILLQSSVHQGQR